MDHSHRPDGKVAIKKYRVIQVKRAHSRIELLLLVVKKSIHSARSERLARATSSVNGIHTTSTWPEFLVS